MKDWVRRNRFFLIALVVLVPAAVVVSLIPRFIPYLEAQPQLEHVERGEVAHYSGADIRLTDLEILDGTDWSAPQGADLVVATFSVDVVEPPEFAVCDVFVISADSGVERRWTETYSTGDYSVPGDFERSCDLSEVASYEMQLVFAVPHDEVVNAEIEITSTGDQPRVLRLS